MITKKIELRGVSPAVVEKLATLPSRALEKILRPPVKGEGHRELFRDASAMKRAIFSPPQQILCARQTLRNLAPQHGGTRILGSSTIPPMHHCSSKPISLALTPANSAEAKAEFIPCDIPMHCRTGCPPKPTLKKPEPARREKSKGKEIVTDFSHPRTQLVDAKGLLACLFSADSRPTVRWVRAQQKAGSIPFYKIGRLVRFNVSAVQSTLNTRNQIQH